MIIQPITNKLAVILLVLATTGCPTIASGITLVGPMLRDAAAQPGGIVEGRLVLRNDAAEPSNVRVSSNDYMFFSTGRTEFGKPGTTPRSNAPWISFTPHQLTVPPGTSANVDYTIHVPADEKLSGSYWSILMVEPIDAPNVDAHTSKLAKPTMSVQTVTRYAVQIATDIGSAGVWKVNFQNERVSVEGIRHILVLGVENAGDRWLRPTVSCEVFDEKGASLGHFAGDRYRLYPGCSTPFHIDVSTLTKGNYQALILADNGDDHVFGTQIPIQIQ